MAGSGEGGERAVAGSGEGGERPLLHSLEYPCTRRLRRRRLLACIRMHSHVDVYLTYAPTKPLLDSSIPRPTPGMIWLITQLID